MMGFFWMLIILPLLIFICSLSLRIISKEGEEGHLIRPDTSLSDEFMDNIRLIPGGEKIKECIQCGICSSSCAVSFAMDYTPRQIWELLRSGLLKKALDSHTVWLCSSCYKCAVRCSTGIPFTDVMYGLKRLGIRKNLNKKGISGPIWTKTFLRNIYRFDRITDVFVMIQFMLLKQPFRIITILPETLKLLFKGRVPIENLLLIVPKSMKSLSVKTDIQRMFKWIDKNVEDI